MQFVFLPPEGEAKGIDKNTASIFRYMRPERLMLGGGDQQQQQQQQQAAFSSSQKSPSNATITSPGTALVKMHVGLFSIAIKASAELMFSILQTATCTILVDRGIYLPRDVQTDASTGAITPVVTSLQQSLTNFSRKLEDFLTMRAFRVDLVLEDRHTRYEVERWTIFAHPLFDATQHSSRCPEVHSILGDQIRTSIGGLTPCNRVRSQFRLELFEAELSEFPAGNSPSWTAVLCETGGVFPLDDDRPSTSSRVQISHGGASPKSSAAVVEDGSVVGDVIPTPQKQQKQPQQQKTAAANGPASSSSPTPHKGNRFSIFSPAHVPPRSSVEISSSAYVDGCRVPDIVCNIRSILARNPVVGALHPNNSGAGSDHHHEGSDNKNPSISSGGEAQQDQQQASRYSPRNSNNNNGKITIRDPSSLLWQSPSLRHGHYYCPLRRACISFLKLEIPVPLTSYTSFLPRPPAGILRFLGTQGGSVPFKVKNMGMRIRASSQNVEKEIETALERVFSANGEFHSSPQLQPLDNANSSEGPLAFAISLPPGAYVRPFGVAIQLKSSLMASQISPSVLIGAGKKQRSGGGAGAVPLAVGGMGGSFASDVGGVSTPPSGNRRHHAGSRLSINTDGWGEEEGEELSEEQRLQASSRTPPKSPAGGYGERSNSLRRRVGVPTSPPSTKSPSGSILFDTNTFAAAVAEVEFHVEVAGSVDGKRWDLICEESIRCRKDGCALIRRSASLLALPEMGRPEVAVAYHHLRYRISHVPAPIVSNDNSSAAAPQPPPPVTTLPKGLVVGFEVYGELLRLGSAAEDAEAAASWLVPRAAPLSPLEIPQLQEESGQNSSFELPPPVSIACCQHMFRNSESNGGGGNFTPSSPFPPSNGNEGLMSTPRKQPNTPSLPPPLQQQASSFLKTGGLFGSLLQQHQLGGGFKSSELDDKDSSAYDVNFSMAYSSCLGGRNPTELHDATYLIGAVPLAIARAQQQQQSLVEVGSVWGSRPGVSMWSALGVSNPVTLQPSLESENGSIANTIVAVEPNGCIYRALRILSAEGDPIPPSQVDVFGVLVISPLRFPLEDENQPPISEMAKPIEAAIAFPGGARGVLSTTNTSTIESGIQVAVGGAAVPSTNEEEDDEDMNDHNASSHVNGDNATINDAASSVGIGVPPPTPSGGSIYQQMNPGGGGGAFNTPMTTVQQLTPPQLSPQTSPPVHAQHSTEFENIPDNNNESIVVNTQFQRILPITSDADSLSILPDGGSLSSTNSPLAAKAGNSEQGNLFNRANSHEGRLLNDVRSDIPIEEVSPPPFALLRSSSRNFKSSLQIIKETTEDDSNRNATPRVKLSYFDAFKIVSEVLLVSVVDCIVREWPESRSHPPPPPRPPVHAGSFVQRGDVIQMALVSDEDIQQPESSPKQKEEEVGNNNVDNEEDEDKVFSVESVRLPVDNDVAAATPVTSSAEGTPVDSPQPFDETKVNSLSSKKGRMGRMILAANRDGSLERVMPPENANSPVDTKGSNKSPEESTPSAEGTPVDSPQPFDETKVNSLSSKKGRMGRMILAANRDGSLERVMPPENADSPVNSKANKSPEESTPSAEGTPVDSPQSFDETKVSSLSKKGRMGRMILAANRDGSLERIMPPPEQESLEAMPSVVEEDKQEQQQHHRHHHPPSIPPPQLPPPAVQPSPSSSEQYNSALTPHGEHLRFHQVDDDALLLLAEEKNAEPKANSILIFKQGDERGVEEESRLSKSLPPSNPLSLRDRWNSVDQALTEFEQLSLMQSSRLDHDNDNHVVKGGGGGGYTRLPPINTSQQPQQQQQQYVNFSPSSSAGTSMMPVPSPSRELLESALGRVVETLTKYAHEAGLSESVFFPRSMSARLQGNVEDHSNSSHHHRIPAPPPARGGGGGPSRPQQQQQQHRGTFDANKAHERRSAPSAFTSHDLDGSFLRKVRPLREPVGGGEGHDLNQWGFAPPMEGEGGAAPPPLFSSSGGSSSNGRGGRGGGMSESSGFSPAREPRTYRQNEQQQQPYYYRQQQQQQPPPLPHPPAAYETRISASQDRQRRLNHVLGRRIDEQQQQQQGQHLRENEQVEDDEEEEEEFEDDNGTFGGQGDDAAVPFLWKTVSPHALKKKKKGSSASSSPRGRRGQKEAWSNSTKNWIPPVSSLTPEGMWTQQNILSLYGGGSRRMDWTSRLNNVVEKNRSHGNSKLANSYLDAVTGESTFRRTTTAVVKNKANNEGENKKLRSTYSGSGAHTARTEGMHAAQSRIRDYPSSSRRPLSLSPSAKYHPLKHSPSVSPSTSPSRVRRGKGETNSNNNNNKSNDNENNQNNDAPSELVGNNDETKEVGEESGNVEVTAAAEAAVEEGQGEEGGNSNNGEGQKVEEVGEKQQEEEGKNEEGEVEAVLNSEEKAQENESPLEQEQQQQQQQDDELLQVECSALSYALVAAEGELGKEKFEAALIIQAVFLRHSVSSQDRDTVIAKVQERKAERKSKKKKSVVVFVNNNGQSIIDDSAADSPPPAAAPPAPSDGIEGEKEEEAENDDHDDAVVNSEVLHLVSSSPEIATFTTGTTEATTILQENATEGEKGATMIKPTPPPLSEKKKKAGGRTRGGSKKAYLPPFQAAAVPLSSLPQFGGGWMGEPLLPMRRRIHLPEQ